jgi:hypothetical protein
MAWLSGWAKRVKLTIDAGDIDADLTWFPVLLKLGTSVGINSEDVSFIFDELQSDANRKKIAVTTDDGETQLYVEIERWDDANEVAWLWVSKTGWVIDDTANTDFYLYYDADHADNTDYVADSSSRPEVWDSYFRAVFHMSEDPSGTAPQIINSVASPAVPVVAQANSWALGAPYNRNIWYANSRWWLFYWRVGSGINYKSATSIENIPYSAATLITANCIGGYACDFVVTGTTLHYISRLAVNENLYYRRGALNADGSISWTAAEQTIDVSAYGIVPIHDICITVDSNGYAWVSWAHTTVASPLKGKVWVIKNANDDGTWSTDGDVGVKQIGPEYKGTGQPCWPTLVPLTSGKMYAMAHSSGTAGGIYYATGDIWNGSAWLGSQETVTAHYTYGGAISAVAGGDDVHLTYGAWDTGYGDYGGTYYRKRDSSTGWGSEAEIKAKKAGPCQACLGKDSLGDLYCFWMDGYYGQTPALTDIYYKKCTSGSWGSPVNWHTSRETIAEVGILTCSYAEQNSSLVLAYTTGDDYPSEDYEKTWVADVLATSQQNAPYATSGGSMLSEDLVDGKIGKALDFDGSDDYLYAPQYPDFSISDFTLEAWASRDTSGGIDYIMAKVSAADKRGWSLDFHSNDYLYGGIRENYPTVAAVWPGSSSTVTDNTWRYLACSFDRDGNGQVYINGAANGSPLSIVSNDDTLDTIAHLFIGNLGYDTTLPPAKAYWFDGKLDEIRISYTLRSAAWLKATYETERDDLLDWGSEEILVLAHSFGIIVG